MRFFTSYKMLIVYIYLFSKINSRYFQFPNKCNNYLKYLIYIIIKNKYLQMLVLFLLKIIN